MKISDEQLQEKAINEAVVGNWKSAIKLNGDIIKTNKKDVDAHLRLGFGYLQIGNLAKSKKAYLKGLSLQPGNLIAITNLEKIRILEKRGGLKSDSKKTHFLDPNLFLNIVGKTKVVSLINIGQANILAKLKIGQKVNVKIKKRRVEIRTESGDYIGALPDDISKRLILFLGAKSQYTTYIKEAAKNSVDVFIVEEKKGKKVQKYTSFPKNIADDIRLMSADDDERTDSDEDDEEEGSPEEAPVDLEKLAEEVVETEYYPAGAGQDDENDEDE